MEKAGTSSKHERQWVLAVFYDNFHSFKSKKKMFISLSLCDFLQESIFHSLSQIDFKASKQSLLDTAFLLFDENIEN